MRLTEDLCLIVTSTGKLWYLNGLLTGPFAGGVAVGVHSEGVDIFIPLP